MSSIHFRKWHRWISIAITVPFFVTVVTGITLAIREFNPWVQPMHPALKSDLKVSFPKILEPVRSVPEAQVETWADVSQTDIRPKADNIRVRPKATHWEVQVDGKTRKVTGHGMRSSYWQIVIHESAYFGPIVRYGIFFPSALGVFFLLISGIVLYLQPYLKKSKKKENPIESDLIHFRKTMPRPRISFWSRVRAPCRLTVRLYPLWHHELTFESLNKIFESIFLDRIPSCEGFKLRPKLDSRDLLALNLNPIILPFQTHFFHLRLTEDQFTICK